MKATAIAHPNIALIKYWGKRDQALNLPAVGSISVTLDTLYTKTAVEFDPMLTQDEFVLNGVEQAKQLIRVENFLDILRKKCGKALYAKVISENNFPTGAGLASSASGFAALTLASSRALALTMSPQELSVLARQGSGSAARSIWGGFVEMALGERSDGKDAVACPLLAASNWPLKVVVAIASEKVKEVGSTDGMELTKQTSPYYASWINHQAHDLSLARDAIAKKDFSALAEVSEASCLKMHAVALSANPGLLYWNGITVECMHAVRRLRSQGVPVFFTIDAGPQVKAVCLPEAAKQVEETLLEVHGVKRTIECGLGPGASLLENANAGVV